MLTKPLTKPLYNPLTRLSEGFTTLASLVKQLFANNEQGWWYDPSDLSTLYQDSAGTTPVTAMEQFVGLMLDKSKGLVLGPELVTNGDFSQGATGWATSGTASISSGKAVISGDGATDGYAITQTISGLSANKSYKLEFDYSNRASGNLYARMWVGATPVQINLTGSSGRATAIIHATTTPTRIQISNIGITSVEIDNISVRELPGNHAYQTTLTKRMKVSRRVNLLDGTAALATQSITTVAGAHTFKFSGAGSVTLSGTATGTYSAGTHSITCTAGTLTVTVTGAVTDASFVPTIKAHLPYQWVNTDTDYDDDPAKFPTYLQGDGIDDCFVTNNIDMTGTDKVNVWAGITKLSDAAAGTVFELSGQADANNGAFYLRAPLSGNDSYDFLSRGTSNSRVVPTGIAAPVTTLLTEIGDISGDHASVRVNGIQVASNTADQGTGNYGKYPLFIGARNQTSLFFGGEIYSLIGRGALSNASQQAAVNQYIKQKMMLP